MAFVIMLSDYLKTIPQFAFPKQKITHIAGLLANVKTPAIKNRLIRYFIAQYGVNMAEAREENPTNYACFNDFFIRQLKPECRPIAPAAVVSPVDGIVSELGHITSGKLLQAKGRYYSVEELLACDKALSDQFNHGYFATLYLSPKDYHRIHMPVEATLKEMIYVPGKLFSVQPATARIIPYLFARNERLVVFFDTQLGLMAMVLVGATIVGAIGTRWHGDINRPTKKQYYDCANISTSEKKLSKGDELGYFKLGSTVILLFANDRNLAWLDTVHAGASICFGQALGTYKHK